MSVGPRSAALGAALVLAWAAGAFGDPPAPALEFHRVHVPAGRLGEVPLGAERYVPMPVAEFDAAVARARVAAGAAAAAPVPPATRARWRAAVDESGRLVGTITCDVGPATAGPGRVLPLGDLRVGRGVVADDPPRAATICGRGADLAVAIPEAGRYELEFSRAPAAADAAVFELPLVPALATTIVLDVAPGMRPVLSGPAAVRAVVVPPAAGAADPWRIDVGPASSLRLAIEPLDRPPPAVAVWDEVHVDATSAVLAATIVPAGPWRAGSLVLEQGAALRVTGIRVLGGDEALDHETAPDGRSITVVLPRWLDGTRAALEVRGVAPATGAGWRLPLLRAGGSAWSGGGSIVRVDPAFVVRDLDLEDCRVVPPDTAAPWPRVEPGPAPFAAAPAALYHVEHQGPAATLRVALGPRTATFDVARVTTVEITRTAVLGRAACDVRVTGGEAFEIAGRVAPGWIIDAVDVVDPAPAGEPAARGPSGAERAIDWRVSPTPVGDALRIGLPAAAGPRGVGLRIAGHRAALASGAAFTTSDIDMVRFDGEAADQAVIDLKTDADAFVEIAGRPAGWFEVEGRLAGLVEEGAARGRIRGGDRAIDVEGRVVRRRPPLDVRVDVQLEPRDDVLLQTFTFECRAAAGVDSLVVDFSEPGGAGLAWRVEAPAAGTVTARRLDPTEGGLASRSDAVAESWLVALDPAAAGPVRIRAVRSVPFTAAVPVPLAWIEGAVEPGGTVAIAAPSGARPRLANRWLRELPPGAAATGVGAEFAYAEPLSGVAADLAPVAPDTDARAWAWSERVACWCDESGATLSESRFDLENEGRDALALTLAPGRRLEGVSVNGAAVSDPAFGADGGTYRVPLPSAPRRVEIVVRTLADGGPHGGAWRVAPAGCALDVPVLTRDVRMLVPPNLVVAVGEHEGAGPRPSWTARLFGGAGRDPGHAGCETGYCSVAVPAADDRGAGVLVVSRRRLAGAATLAALVAGAAAFLRGRRRPEAAGVVVAAAAVAALWLPPAFMPVARAAWWGGLAGLGCALVPAGPWRLRLRPPAWLARFASTASVVVVAVAAMAPAAAEPGLRVFVTPAAGGETALVPEPLFRALAAFAAPDAAVRVLASRIDAARDPQTPWRLELDLDADAGATLSLDAGPPARWLPPRDPPAGVVARITGPRVQLTLDTAGRHTVALEVVPGLERHGPLAVATLRIPVAPTASLRLGDGDPAAGTLACESAAGGTFASARRVSDVGQGVAFDVSVADRVRLVQPVDPRDRLAAAVRTAATVDSLAWDGAGCAVEAAFDIDTEGELLRSFVVRADPRLEGLAVVPGEHDAPRLEPLGAGRARVELPEATRGNVRVRLAARLPVADPVGVFEAPGIWLEGVPAERRTVELRATADLDAVLDPPPPAAATAADLAGRPPARVVVRRRRALLRGAQTLGVSFAPAETRLTLEAQLDATSLALTRIPLDVPVGSTIDRVALLVDEPDAAAPSPAVDVVWTRSAADRVLVIVQRPRPGRFRLEVEARLARRPAPSGRLPVVRARLGAAVPLLIAASAVPPLAVQLTTAADAGRADVVEVPDDAAEPEYALGIVEEPMVEPVPPADDAASAAGVEWAEVGVVFDGRGRVHGLARFDLTTGEPLVRLRLPPGVRLFDVLVDGRVAAAEPRAVDAWDVPLGAAAWPRTVLVVFAGDAGTAWADNRPLALAPPRLEGLASPAVHWQLRPPAGHVLRVAPPARPLEAAALRAARADAGARIAAACDRSAAGGAQADRARLEALAELRRAGRGPAAEQAWLNAAGWDDATATCVVTTEAEPVVIRAASRPDATTPGRAAATIALVATAGLAWTIMGRARSMRAGD